MNYRFAQSSDLKLLAELNQQLIRNEGRRLPLSAEDLEVRLRGWLRQEYRAILFEDGGQVVAYALYRPDEFGGIYLRQFFVRPERRRQGIGRSAFEILQNRIWPPGSRITLEVLVGNEQARRFWTALGFEDHALTLEYRGSSSPA